MFTFDPDKSLSYSLYDFEASIIMELKHMLQMCSNTVLRLYELI